VTTARRRLLGAVLDVRQQLLTATSGADPAEPVLNPPLPRLTARTARPLDAEEHALVAAIRSQRHDWTALLMRAIDVNSGSHHHAGVARVQKLFAGELRRIGYAGRTIALRGEAAALHRCYRRPRRHSRVRPRVLLLGHVDTVFEPGCGFERAVQLDGHLRGPGAADMKGGVVTMVAALAGLAERSLLDGCAPTLLLTGDEEIGAPSSRAVIRREARRHDLGLVLEPGRERPMGAVILARPGAAAARLSVVGQAAHSGNRYIDGVSAVDDLARKLIALSRLTDLERGLIVNPGRFETGPGAKRNRVADFAAAELDLRFRDLEGAELLRGALDQFGLPPLVSNPWTEATTASTLEWDLHCPPMPYQAARGALYRDLAGIAGRLAVPIGASAAAGGSDANTLAAEGLLVLDGLGPVGGEFHTQAEWVDLDSLIDRACLLAVFLHRLARRRGVHQHPLP